jgi:hypothetical protein
MGEDLYTARMHLDILEQLDYNRTNNLNNRLQLIVNLLKGYSIRYDEICSSESVTRQTTILKKNKEIIEQFLNDSRFQDPTIAAIEGRYRREQRQRAGRKTRRRKKRTVTKRKSRK